MGYGNYYRFGFKKHRDDLDIAVVHKTKKSLDKVMRASGELVLKTYPEAVILRAEMHYKVGFERVTHTVPLRAYIDSGYDFRKLGEYKEERRDR